MAKQNINSKEGFTIIEVVLVLAIAGLIFLMVFVALPSLQRSQRDTQRRNDLSRLGTALTQWQTNHGTSVKNLPVESSWKGIATFDTSVTTGDNIAASNCVANNDACKLVRDYLNTSASGKKFDNSFIDPDGTPYNIVVTKNIASDTGIASVAGQGDNGSNASLDWSNNTYSLGGTDPYSAHTVFIVPGGKCVNDTIQKSENRRYAMIYRLEGSGTYCLDDQ